MSNISVLSMLNVSVYPMVSPMGADEKCEKFVFPD